jgi:cytochrome c553
MSKITPDCIICHDRPAADVYGWCDECARLYDQPAEPTTADLAESHRTYRPSPRNRPCASRRELPF